MATPAQPAADKATPRPWMQMDYHIHGAKPNREFVGSAFSLVDAELIVRAVNQSAAFDAVEKAIREIASQKLSSEIEPIDRDADFEYAYDMAITVARAALKAVAEASQ